jgi:poly(3-hydroxybutyrate) depolymerase
MRISALPSARMPGRRARLAAVATAVSLVLTLIGATLTGPVYGAFPALAAPTAGCGKAPMLTSGARSTQSGGQNRSYILRIPGGYDRNHPYRLFFGFHWNGGTANDVDSGGSDGAVWSYYGQRQLANDSAIFVAPQGNGNGWANPGGQDITFVDDLIRLLENDLCVDTTQVFALGFSYGGGMSYALACARAGVFRAVAVYSGGQLSGCSSGGQPIAYMGIHGVGDPVLNISAGRSLRDTFVRANGCAAQSPPEPQPGSLTHVVTAYPGCRAGYPVVWAAFDGGHTPGPVDGGGDSGARSWTRAEVWKFFSQFSSGTPTSGPTSGPTSQPPTTPPTGTAGCRITATVNGWNTGLTENLTVTNTGSTAISGWSLTFTLPAGQAITSAWNASYQPASGQVTARNLAYNADLAPNASISIGFQATHTGNTAAAGAFALNGSACAAA